MEILLYLAFGLGFGFAIAFIIMLIFVARRSTYPSRNVNQFEETLKNIKNIQKELEQLDERLDVVKEALLLAEQIPTPQNIFTAMSKLSMYYGSAYNCLSDQITLLFDALEILSRDVWNLQPKRETTTQ